MRRVTVVLVLLVLAATVSAQTPKLGAGVFGGLSIPLLQEDQGKGSVFGFRARFGLSSFLALEGQLGFTKWGTHDPVDGIVMPDGSKLTQFGVSGLLGGGMGAGVKPMFIGGIGSYKIKNKQTGFDQSKVGYNLGLGLGIGLGPKFGIDARGEALIIRFGEGSKKAISGSVGLMMFF